MENNIESHLKEQRIFEVPKEFQDQATIQGPEEYETLYNESIRSPETFWARQAEENISWFKKWDNVFSHDFNSIGEVKEPYVKFFEGAKLNISYNCLDRHLEDQGDKPAIIWQGEDEEQKRTLTYNQLHKEVCRFSNVLKKGAH